MTAKMGPGRTYVNLQTAPLPTVSQVEYSRRIGALQKAADILRHACGNMYWNDKSTGAVVGEQPFGGA